MITDEQMHEALRRFAHTPDGQLFYRYLQKTLCGITADLDDGALRRHDGRRMFASELMGLMAKEIADSDRYAITFSVVARASAGHAPRGAGRRVTLDTPVAGYDTPDSGAT